MAKWYQKATVQSALVTGVFLLLASSLTVVLRDCGRTTDSDELSYTDQTNLYLKDLKIKAVWLKGVYERIDSVVSDPAVSTVRIEAPKVAEQLLGIPDAELSVSRQILKYGYAGMLYVISGQLETGNEAVSSNSTKAIEALDQAIVLAEIASDTKDAGSQKLQVAEWVLKEDIEYWLNYNRAIAEALRIKANHHSSWQVIEQYLRRIPPAYLERYPIKLNPALSWACRKLMTSANKLYCSEVHDE